MSSAPPTPRARNCRIWRGDSRAGGDPVIVDVGTRPATIPPDIPRSRGRGRRRPGPAEPDDRGRAVAAMAQAFAGLRRARNDIAGIIGIGGGGGTSIVTAGMRELPLGLPKLMVSTLASGDVSPYVGVSDIVMMPSITDMAGLNRISRVILHNAAAGDRRHGGSCRQPTGRASRRIGLTMFGVTTPASRRSSSVWASATTAWSSTRPAPAAARWRSWPTAACCRA